MASKRKPYVREMDAGWWRKHPFYRFYMLRESTSIFAVWVSLLLICGLAHSDLQSYFKLLANPVVVFLNIVAFLAALLHTKTWFDLAPKAVNGTEKQTAMLKTALWVITGAASLAVLLVAFAA